MVQFLDEDHVGSKKISARTSFRTNESKKSKEKKDKLKTFDVSKKMKSKVRHRRGCYDKFE